MTIESRSFIIPASNQTMVEAQMIKLNKRAFKLGLDPIVITWDKAITDAKGTVLLPCNLTGPISIQYEGWTFIATLQHLPTGENIVRSISKDHDVPTEYHTSGSDCQHCNSKRYRKDTYIVRHNPAIYRQVGSSCIRDFLGGNSPDNLLQKASFIGELISFMNGASSLMGGRDEGIYHIVAFLAHTSAVINKYGWLSKSKAQEGGGIPTASRVQDNLHEPKLLLSAEDKVKAKDTSEWAENISDDEAESSDYIHNIRAIARSGMVGYRTAGFAASILNAYLRATEVKVIKTSNHVGEIKKRQIFEVVLNKHFVYDGQFGTLNKYIFNDESGNVIIWATTSHQDFEIGKRYGVKGTIKEHSEFKGIKQTIINRCEVVTYYGE